MRQTERSCERMYAYLVNASEDPIQKIVNKIDCELRLLEN